MNLPVRATAPAEAADSEPHSSTPRSQRAEVARLDGVHVVVADDDEDSRDLIASALEGAGATVSLVESANAAFASISRSPPSLLISDVGMPEEDGYSLIRRVRRLAAEEGGSVPAIALTAYARREDERLALDAGFDCHLAKPVDPARLTEAVARLARPHGEAYAPR